MTEKLQVEVEVIPNMSKFDSAIKKASSSSGMRSALGAYGTAPSSQKLLGGLQASFKTASAPVDVNKLFSTLGKGKDIDGKTGGETAGKGIAGALKGIGVVALLGSLVMQTKPVQMLLKIVVALLTMTLYPIFKFVMMILKPVIVFFFKVLILFHKWLGGSLKAETKKDIGKLDPSGEMGKQYEALNDNAKDLVGFGQEFGKLLGVDIIAAGKGFGDWFRSLPAHFDIAARAFLEGFGGVVTGFINIFVPFTEWAKTLPAQFDIAIYPIREWWNGLPAWFAGVIAPVKTWWDGLPAWFQGIVDGVGTWWDNLPNWFDEQMAGIIGIGGKIFDFIMEQITSMVRNVIPTPVSDTIDSISKFLSGERASGGPVSGGGSYLVGEKGPEIFTPGVGGNITPNNIMGGGGGNITINIQGNVDSQATINKIVEAVNRAQYQNSKKVGAW